jgi:uncharacterized protein (TIGR00255 family)
MALKSMTGFGAGSARAEGVQIAVELSSVNRKQLEVALRLPPQLTAFEPQVQKLVQQSLSRGRVSGSVTLELPAGETAVTVDQNRAEAVIKKLRSSAKKLNLEDDLSASMLLRIPNLLEFQMVEKKSDDLFQTLEKALSVALKKLVTLRAKVGRALSDDLKARLNALEVMLEKIIEFAPDRLGGTQARSELFDMAGQPRDLFSDIALLAKQRDLFEHPLIGGQIFEAELFQPLEHFFPTFGNHRRRERNNLFEHHLERI